MAEIINRVAQSPLLTLRLEDYYLPGERVLIDIKEQLFQGMILREKDFRAWLDAHDWSQYQGKHVAVLCSADAIIQTWAWMLIAAKLQPYALSMCHGDMERLEARLWWQAIEAIDYDAFKGRPVIVKGCSQHPIPPGIYMEVARRLRPVVKKLSFGEACSTVPL